MNGNFMKYLAQMKANRNNLYFIIIYMCIDSGFNFYRTTNSYRIETNLLINFIYLNYWFSGLLEMVPKPVIAVLMLFPITENSENYKKKQLEDLVKSGSKPNNDLYHMKQTVGNACGTIGLVHAVLNNRDKISLSKNAWFD